MATLTAQPISQSAFSAYGWLVDSSGAHYAATNDITHRTINQGSSQRLDGLSELALDAEGGKPCLAVFKATARDPAGPWHELEKHSFGTQTFIPLNGVRYLALVALGGDAPDVSTLAAFVVQGHQGVTLRPGTWHHGLLALDDGDFVVIERQAVDVDCDIFMLAEPVSIVLG